MGKQWKQWQALFLGAPKSLQMVTAAMKLKDACSLEKSYEQPKQHIKKQRHYFVNKGPSSQGMVFPGVMYGCKSWTIKKAVGCQTPLLMGFFRQECWSGLLCPSPEDLPDPGIEPRSPALEADALTSEPPGKP